jgi:hypothetical protein
MKKDMDNHSTNWNVCIVLSALLIPAFFIRCFFANAQIITNDGLIYIKIAKGISSGNLQSVTDYGFFNLYSFLITLFQTVLHDWEISGKAVSVVFGALTIIPLFFLTKRLFSQKIAIVSALLYGIHPRFVEYSSDVLREPVFWFFSVAALWLAWEGILRRRCFLFVLSSLATGFAIFTRLEGVLVFFAVILWILWFFLNDQENRRKGSLFAFIFVFSLPVLASPGLVLLKNKLNRWEAGLSMEKIPQLICGDSQRLELPPDVSRSLPGKFQAFSVLSVRHRYMTFLMETLYKFFKSSGIVLFLLFLCGIYKRRFIPYSQKDKIVLIWFSVAFLGSLLYVSRTFYLGTRHGLLVVFPALIWAGVGFFEIRERIRKWFEGVKLFQKYAGCDTLFLIILMLTILIPQTIYSVRNDKTELKKAGVVLKDMGFSNTTFIVQPTLNRIAFYAGAESVVLPDEIDNSVMKALVTQHHSTLLIIDERTIDNYLPGIRNIIEKSMPEKLVIPEMGQYRKYSFSIYKIRQGMFD